MNKVTLRISLPEFSEEDFKFALKYNKFFVSGFLLINYVTLWRAQISQSQVSDSVSRKDLQGTPSMRFIAKLYNRIEPIHWLIASAAVFKTSFFDQKDYIELPLDKRDSFVEQRIADAVSIIGPSKILSPRQIGSYSELLTHRRGIMAKFRGTLQSISLYNPGTVLKGVNISYLTWNQFVEIFYVTLEKMGLSELDIVTTLLRNVEHELIFEDEASINAVCKEIIRHYILADDESDLLFEDGIIVSGDESNKVPLESILPIIRKRPVIFPEISIQPADDDIFMKSAVKQQAEYKKLYKPSRTPGKIKRSKSK